MDFGRMLTAMATPFGHDGEIDDFALERMVNHLIDTGTTSIVVCGTTGESPTLTHEEKLHLFEKIMKYVDGRVPVIAGTGSNNTKSSIQLSREAEKIGVHGLLLVAPYYNRPTQDGLIAHFKSIAEAVDLPIMLYNIPGRSGVNMSVPTIMELAGVPNIFAVKEASGDFAQIMQIAASKPDDFLLYSGDDKFTLPLLAVGGYGIVSVASHVVGREIRSMIDAHLAGDVQNAALWNARLLPVFESLFLVSSPAPLKAALHLLGLSENSVRLPLVSAPQAVVDKVKFELAKLGKLA
jgi:4-hydroxy-tetrahydrodipicolinate synthase